MPKSHISSALLNSRCFLLRFQVCNHLHTLHSFIFEQGMHFLDSRQWWNEKKRPRPHEGIDIVFYLDNCNKKRYFPTQTLVPALFSGTVAHIHKDFLGHTLYIRHDGIEQNAKILHSLYSHIVPRVRIGEKIETDTIIGKTHSVSDRRLVPPHLHLSISWIEKNMKLEKIYWENILDYAEIQLIEPMTFIQTAAQDMEKCIYTV